MQMLYIAACAASVPVHVWSVSSHLGEIHLIKTIGSS